MQGAQVVDFVCLRNPLTWAGNFKFYPLVIIMRTFNPSLDREMLALPLGMGIMHLSQIACSGRQSMA